jgi:hypothetical protein
MKHIEDFVRSAEPVAVLWEGGVRVMDIGCRIVRRPPSPGPAPDCMDSRRTDRGTIRFCVRRDCDRF